MPISTDPRDHGRGMSRGGRSRGLLAFTELERFAAWAEATRGYKRVDHLTGACEVLRLMPPRGKHPVIFYRKIDATVHVTAFNEGLHLARKYIAWKQRYRCRYCKELPPVTAPDRCPNCNIALPCAHPSGEP